MRILRPSPKTVERFLASQREGSFTYSQVGATNVERPEDCSVAGFVVDYAQTQLGTGEEAFRSAEMALRQWLQFQLGWVRVANPQVPIEVGEVAVVIARIAGIWWLNACRIIYVIKESGPRCRFGFAYGTLPGHAESGEERFLIEWDQASNQVTYSILAFSRPNQRLARLGYPVVRRIQKRFARESQRVMQRASLPGGTPR